MPSIAFFHAPDDAIARLVGARSTSPDEVELSEALRELECFLTGRSYDDVNCDDRHLAIISEVDLYVDAYVATVTDTLRDALAAADDETLQAASNRWPVAAKLVSVSRNAVSAGERLYVSWTAAP
jgi:hypothetical protein